MSNKLYFDNFKLQPCYLGSIENLESEKKILDSEISAMTNNIFHKDR